MSELNRINISDQSGIRNPNFGKVFELPWRNEFLRLLYTAYQYRNLLGRILLLAKMMIVVNHDCHKYKYEFQKNSKCFVKLKYNFFKVVIILYCLYTAKNILMVFFFNLEIFPPKFIFI